MVSGEKHIAARAGRRSPAKRAAAAGSGGRTGFRATGPMLAVLLALLAVWGLFLLFGGDDEEPSAAPAPAGATDTLAVAG